MLMPMELSEILWWAGLVMLGASLVPPSLHYMRAKRARTEFRGPEPSDHRPRLTVVLPMKNEAAHVIRKIDEVTSMPYPAGTAKILLIDSGSIDGTAAMAEQHLDSLATPHEWAVHALETPGKSVAVNAALGMLDTEFFVMMDADAYCSAYSLERLMDWFSDPDIGAVCGQFSSLDMSTEWAYRARFNTLRVGESVIDSTPVFEGSVCAFRVAALSRKGIHAGINADDSQLAIMARANGYRAVMDPDVAFSEDSKRTPRSRRVRRAQGLSRALYQARGLGRSQGSYGVIMRQALYFHLLMPWLVILSVATILVSAASGVTLASPLEAMWPNAVITVILLALAFATRTGRGLFSGISVLVESHVRLALGQSLEVWDTNRHDP